MAKRPMRRLSNKRRREYQAIKQERAAFRREFPRCMVDPRHASEDVHEIARGPARREAVKRRETWLAVCRQCHDSLEDYTTWPIAKQLALKRLRDPAWFDRVAVNRMRGRDDDAITTREVDIWVRRLLHSGP